MQKTDVRPTAATGESKLHFLDYWRVIRVRLGIVILSFLLVVITAGVTTYFQPRKYRAAVTLQLREPTGSFAVFRTDGSEGGGNQDPRFIATQNELITTHDFLNPVIDGQDLQRKWATDGLPLPKESAYYKLRSMISLKPVRGTDLLELAVMSTSPDEAKQIDDAVADSYQNIRKSTDRIVAQGGIADLNTHLDTMRQTVLVLRQKMAQFRKDHPELRDPNPDDITRHEDPYEAEVNTKQQEVDRYTTQIAGYKGQLDQVTQLRGDELMRALAVLNINDPTIQNILPKYQDAVSGEAQLLNSGAWA